MYKTNHPTALTDQLELEFRGTPSYVISVLQHSAPLHYAVAEGWSALRMSLPHYLFGKIPSNESELLLRWADQSSDTDRLWLREIGNERRDSIGQLEQKLRVLQV